MKAHAPAVEQAGEGFAVFKTAARVVALVLKVDFPLVVVAKLMQGVKRGAAYREKALGGILPAGEERILQQAPAVAKLIIDEGPPGLFYFVLIERKPQSNRAVFVRPCRPAFATVIAGLV